MTSPPAQILGLKDRGLLRENYRAGVTIFDPEKVRAASTRINMRKARLTLWSTASWSWMRERSLANCRARFWQNRVAGETQRINHDEETFFMLRFHSSSLLNRDRKSTRLNSSHLGISYAVFCL